MVNWEYTIISIRQKIMSDKDVGEAKKILNDLGKDGWELIEVIPLTSAGENVGTRFFLKRKIGFVY